MQFSNKILNQVSNFREFHQELRILFRISVGKFHIGGLISLACQLIDKIWFIRVVRSSSFSLPKTDQAEA